MDDSDQDFVDLCSRFLKRVHKKRTHRGESDEERNVSLSQVKGGAKRRFQKHNVEPGSKRQLVDQAAIQPQAPWPTPGERIFKETTTSHGAAVIAAAPQVSCLQPESLGVKDKVVLRMQKFKRVSPQRMKLNAELTEPPGDTCQLPHMPGHAVSPQGDEAVALRLQQEQELHGEVHAVSVDLEFGGMFFCQICQRDLSAMTSLRRSQHVNRCLDGSETSTLPSPAPPRVPECPVCGKCFKSQKSRLAHVKRCSVDMGVAPAVLMEALQRQNDEATNHTANDRKARGQKSKRAGSEDIIRPVRKKPKKQLSSLDEDTLVAMALSRSVLDQNQEEQKKKEMEMQSAASYGGKRRGKKKGYPPAVPPLLLIQDHQEAFRRLQDRIAALLLRTEPPVPPTPQLPSSTLSAWMGAAPLWQRSALQDGGPSSIQEFYTPELIPPIEPWIQPSMQRKLVPVLSSQTLSGPSSEAVIRPADSPCALEKLVDPAFGSAPLPSISVPPVSSQAMRDLMDLAEEGMTLTQCGHVSEPVNEKGSVGRFPLSGYIPEEDGETPNNVALCRLTADLASMVNNPQLSDVQLQVDSGDVFFAHFFMLYARCPSLVQLAHDSGFGVQEDGMPQAQRVLLGDVPAEAALVLLQYIYTGHCSLKSALVPHVQELAVRLELRELEELCQQSTEETVVEPWAEFRQSQDNANRSKQNFLELLQSMWEDEENEEGCGGGTADEQGCGQYGNERASSPTLGGDGELGEEIVGEEELEEIYEFAATQRNLGSGGDAVGESGQEDDDEAGLSTEEGAEYRDREMEDGVSKQKQSHQVIGEIKKIATEVADNRWQSSSGRFTSETCRKVHDPHALDECPPNTEPDVLADIRKEQPGGVIVPMTVHFMEDGRGTSLRELKGTVKPNEVHNADTSLDKSYNYLFSQSWGEYVEPSSTPAHVCSPSLGNRTVGQPEAECEKTVLTPSLKECSQLLSAHNQEAIIDLSISPPLHTSMSKYPVTTLSVACVLDKKEGDLNIGNFSGNGRSQVSHYKKKVVREEQSTAVRISNLPGNNVHCGQVGQPAMPELIVLSDSGDEMDVDLKNVETGLHIDSNQPSPQMRQDPLSSLDGANCGPEPVGGLTALPGKLIQSRSKEEASQDSLKVSSSSCSSSFGNSHIENSMDNSWLVPGTPMQSPKVTRTGCTQTHISMCRTQLFPKSSTSSSTSVCGNKTSTTSRIAQTFHHTTQVKLCTVDCLDITEKQTVGNFHSSDFKKSSGSGQEDVPKKMSMVTVDAKWTANHRQPESRSEEKCLEHIACSSQSQLSRQPSHECEDVVPRVIGWHGVPPAASSTPLAADTTEHLSASRHSAPISNSEHDMCLSQRSASRKLGQADEPSVENPHGQSSGSLHLSRSSLSPYSDAGTRLRLNEASGKCRSSRELDHPRSLSSEMEGSPAEEPQSRSPSVHSFCVMDEPPIPCDDSWSPSARFSLRMDSSEGASPLQQDQNKATAQGICPSPSITCPVTPQTTTKLHASMLDSKLWDDWGEAEEDARLDLPLSQRVCPLVPVQRDTKLKTPVAACRTGCPPMEPVTPMPVYSDMDTPELKNQLNRFGVRPLPKRQMVLKLKEIHQYTHQLQSSDSEGEAVGPLQKPGSVCLPRHSFTEAQPRPGSTLGTTRFKEPEGAVPRMFPKAVSCPTQDEEGSLSASQGSTASSVTGSEDSERSNPETCPVSQDDSDSEEVTPSQAVSRNTEKLQAVRHLIQSDLDLYRQILQYQPLVLSQLQARLKAAGIRLGAGKLLDFLDSQCITVTTANPNKPGSPRGRSKRGGRVKGCRGAAQSSG